MKYRELVTKLLGHFLEQLEWKHIASGEVKYGQILCCKLDAEETDSKSDNLWST